MHNFLKEKWNNKVGRADHVYILGDLVWLENEEAIKLVSVLNGNKHLIVGNHDRVKDQRYKQLFTEIVDMKEITDNFDGKSYKLVLCHYPIMFWKGQHKGTIHLYGHVHNTIEQDIFQKFVEELNEKHDIDCEAYNVGCMIEYMNYEPKTLKEIVEGDKA